LLNLIITDLSLYCSQWDYQDNKPVLFSLVKVNFHSALSSIRSEPDEIQNNIRTAIAQIDDFNNVQRTTGYVILDCSLTEKDSINIGELSNKNEIEKFFLWTLKKRWGKQVNRLSFSFIPGNLYYYYFAFPRILLTQLNIILNELGLVNVSFTPMETLFQLRGEKNGILIRDGKTELFFCFTEMGIMSCKISKRKEILELKEIIGNPDDINTLLNDKKFKICMVDNIETEKLLQTRKILQLTPFRNIITDSIDLRMNIPDRILNALDRSIAQHSEGNDVNYYLNPFINIIDHDELSKKRLSSLSENKLMININDKSENGEKTEPVSRWIMFLLLISLSGLILFKNSDIEYWKNKFVNLFHPSKYSEKSTVKNSDYLTPYQFEPYDEYNLSRAILNVFIYSFEKISSRNIFFLSSLDDKYTVVSSIDTIYTLFSSLGVIDNEIELEDNQYQMELILSTKKTIPNSFIQNVEEIISIFVNNSSLTSHRKLEEKVNEIFIYDPLILSFTNLVSPLNVLNQMKELGGNVLIRKIVYTPSMEKMEKSNLTVYLSVIKWTQDK